MFKRSFVTSLLGLAVLALGIGFFARSAEALPVADLTRDSLPAISAEHAMATPTDISAAKVEKARYHVRRRIIYRRHYYRPYYYYRPRYYRPRYYHYYRW